jgi:RNA polymerase sigma-70 factor (ECF subfamily)
LAGKILRDEALAEDAVQNAFLRMYEKREGFRNEADPRTWAMRIVWNQCLMMRRSPQYSRRVYVDTLGAEIGDGFFDRLVDPAANPEAQCHAAFIKRQWKEGIAGLKPSRQRIYLLRYVKGLSVEETQQITGMGEGAVKSTAKRAADDVQAYVRHSLMGRCGLEQPPRRPAPKVVRAQDSISAP